MHPRIRRSSAALLAAGMAIASLGIGAAADSPNNPKADVQRGNQACGEDRSYEAMGFVNYHRTGDRVRVQFHIKDGEPNRTYHVQLWEWNSGSFACNFVGPFLAEQSFPWGKEVTTNRKGVANANISVEVDPSWTRFFAAAWDTTDSKFHDALLVTLER
jgi:hypothetical protein